MKPVGVKKEWHSEVAMVRSDRPKSDRHAPSLTLVSPQSYDRLSRGFTGMTADGKLKWEPAGPFVDRQISPDRLHVWPFCGSYPIDVRFLILDRRYSIPAHRPDHLEVVVFESGELGYEVEDKTCTVAKNDIIVVGDRLRHRCLSLKASQTEARTVVLSFLPQTVHSGAPLGDDVQYLMPFSLNNPSIPNVIFANKSLAREILDLIERIRGEMPALPSTPASPSGLT